MFLRVEEQLGRAERVIRQRVRPKIYSDLTECQVRSYEIAGELPAADDFLADVHACKVDFEPFATGQPWGTTWGTTWFEVTGSVGNLASGVPVEMVVDLGWYDHSVGLHIEALAYRDDGTAIKALHPKNNWLRLVNEDGSQDAVVNEDGTFTLYLEAACNPLILGVPAFIKTSLGERATGKPDEQYVLRSVAVGEHHAEVEGLWMDLDVVTSLMKELDPESLRYWNLAAALQKALNLYDERNLETVPRARQALAGVLSSPASASVLKNTAIGHAHIDSAWLWPVRETRRKVARTVANVLALMERYPDFTYAMSSAQQYAWLEEDHPDLFARVQQRVAEGRFIPVGGMWVESDGMIPTGESLIRQIRYGKQYFAEKFGVEPKGIWLPDSFGYTGAFPQIAKRAGYEWFLTQKISWNDTTKFPHHTFWWEGIDGSQILTHFPPSDTYAAEVTLKELVHSERNFRDKDVSQNALMLFGYGDGGGGPTREMMERLHRLGNLEGSPRVEIGRPDDFFERARADVSRETLNDVPTWKGELYLELHRGTLTSQQDMKKGCRQEESLLRTVEYLCTVAQLKNSEYSYPTEQLDRIWKTLLLNQFHDILPGSGLAWVHREARADYARDLARLREIAVHACAAIDDVSTLEHAQAARISQFNAEPSASWTVKSSPAVHKSAVAVGHEFGTDRIFIDNGLLKVTIESDGHISSLYDSTAQREVVPQGSSLGGYELLRNEPEMWDAWEISRDALLSSTPMENSHIVSAQIAPDECAKVVIATESNDARIETTVSLAPESLHLDFAATIDWRAEEKFLKVGIPVTLQPRTAQFECQYGMVERPVIKNTPGDDAMFESCTHRFIRLSDPEYAVSVVNASTYGADTKPLPRDSAAGRAAGTLIRLSLLSSPQFPDPTTDIGTHEFEWSLVVGSEGQLAATLERAGDINAPILPEIPVIEPLVTLANVHGIPVIDWIKTANDGSGDIIARIYEASGGTASAHVSVSADLAGARIREVDVLERTQLPEDEPIALREDGTVILGPYQLTTLRITR